MTEEQWIEAALAIRVFGSHTRVTKREGRKVWLNCSHWDTSYAGMVSKAFNEEYPLEDKLSIKTVDDPELGKYAPGERVVEIKLRRKKRNETNPATIFIAATVKACQNFGFKAMMSSNSGVVEKRATISNAHITFKGGSLTISISEELQILARLDGHRGLCVLPVLGHMTHTTPEFLVTCAAQAVKATKDIDILFQRVLLGKIKI